MATLSIVNTLIKKIDRSLCLLWLYRNETFFEDARTEEQGEGPKNEKNWGNEELEKGMKD